MIEVPDVVGGYLLVERLEMQRLNADLAALRAELSKPKALLSVQEARVRTMEELQRATDDKLEQAAESGRDMAVALYEDELAPARGYNAAIRTLVLNAKLALPAGATDSYLLLKEALELKNVG
jgi:hypothetical protein